MQNPGRFIVRALREAPEPTRLCCPLTLGDQGLKIRGMGIRSSDEPLLPQVSRTEVGRLVDRQLVESAVNEPEQVPQPKSRSLLRTISPVLHLRGIQADSCFFTWKVLSGHGGLCGS